MSDQNKFSLSLIFKGAALLGILALIYWKFVYTPDVVLESIDCYDIHDQKVNMQTGRPAIVSFYQTWCSDCRRETPVLDSFAKANGIDLYFISDEPTEKTTKFKELFPAVTCFYFSKKSMAEIGIKKYPTVYFFNSKGKLVMKKLEVVDASDLQGFLKSKD